MTIKFSYKYLWVGFSFFLMFPVFGNPSSIPTFRFSPLVITPKEPLNWMINPGTRLLKGQEWRLLQSETVSESLEGISNITVLPIGGPQSLTTISMSGAPSSGTLVLWENLTLNDPASSDGVFDFSTLGADMFDRIEIFQGNDPRFGTSGTGGTIRLHNSLDNQSLQPTKIKMEGGSFGESLLNASHIISFDTGKLKIGASGFRGDGAPLSVNPSYRKRQGFQNGSINLSGKFDLKKSTYVSFFVKTGESRLEDLYNALGHFQNNNYLAAVNISQKSLDGKTEEKFSFLKNLLARQSFISSDKNSTFKGDRMEGKYSLNHVFGPRMLIESGIGVIRESLYQFSLMKNKSSVCALTKERSLGYVFLSPVWKIIPPLALSMGGRAEGEMEGNTLFAAKGALEYQKEGRICSLSYDVAQKRPTLFELYASDSYTQGNQSLKPEQSQGAQIFLVQKELIRKTDLGVRLFEREFKRAIGGILQGGQWIYQESPSFRSKGIEPFFDIKFSNAWKMHGELTYTKLSHASFFPRILTPSFKASGTLFYIFEEGQDPNIDASALYLKVRYIRSSPSAGGQKLSSYAVFDMGGQYQVTRNMNFFVRLNNMFNASYRQQIDTSLKGEPLMVHVGIGMQF